MILPDTIGIHELVAKLGVLATSESNQLGVEEGHSIGGGTIEAGTGSACRGGLLEGTNLVGVDVAATGVGNSLGVTAGVVSPTRELDGGTGETLFALVPVVYTLGVGVQQAGLVNRGANGRTDLIEAGGGRKPTGRTPMAV